MINLLPPQAKQAVKREYWIRMLGAWALLGTAVTLVGIVLLVPTYVLLTRQLEALSLEVIERAQYDTGAYDTARRTLEAAHALATQLNASVTIPPASTVLAEIQMVQPQGVTLEGFTYTYTENGELLVEVEGNADTRAALVRFSDALERNPLFAAARVPVSDLARDRNLPFTISIAVNRIEH